MSIKKKIRTVIKKNLVINGFSSLLYNLPNRHRIKGSRLNLVNYKNSYLKNVSIKIEGSNNQISIDKLTFIRESRISIKGRNNTIIIGQYCGINELEVIIEDDNNTIIIGDKSTIGGLTHLACLEGCSISIGEDCMFSKDITFRTGDSHSIVDLNGSRMNISKDIFIGNHVWIGNKAILLKGSTLKDNSIVATGSVVTKSFDVGNVIIAGSPARIVKENVTWVRERI